MRKRVVGIEVREVVGAQLLQALEASVRVVTVPLSETRTLEG